MAVKNQIVPKAQQQTASMAAFLNKPNVLANIDQTLGVENRQRFITGVISAVNANPVLKECTQMSVLSGALLGESLKLSPSPQLGHYYLVPYDQKEKTDRNGNVVTPAAKVAQFQMGYKGYIQLAIRSGQYRNINVISIKAGELEYFDPLTEEIKVNLIRDFEARENAPTIGYYAMFRLNNGFCKAIYWSKQKMEAHAVKYSPGYRKDREKGWTSTFWSKDFDGMAYKTMLRQLIGKWGIMSIEMQNAFEGDMTYAEDFGKNTYPENIAEPITDDFSPVIEAPAPEEMTEYSEPIPAAENISAALFGG